VDIAAQKRTFVKNEKVCITVAKAIRHAFLDIVASIAMSVNIKEAMDSHAYAMSSVDLRINVTIVHATSPQALVS
jgi:hypothetical protein